MYIRGNNYNVIRNKYAMKNLTALKEKKTPFFISAGTGL